jgi:MoaA/NifB/PqqE/SkfB family radical SAM enzyme
MYQTKIARTIREQRILFDVSLELTYACNLDCFFCYNDRDKPGKPLSLAQYHRLLEDLARMQTLHLMLTGGEPMVHPHFFAIGRKARDLGFVTRVRTNGHSLNRRMAERVRDEVEPYAVEVSLHGATAEVHDRQTRVPGSFQRLIANVRAGSEAGLRMNVVTTPTAWNEHQIEDMVALCDSLGVPIRFQGPVGPRDNGDTTPLSIQPAPETWGRVTELVERRRAERDAEQSCAGKAAPAVEMERTPEVQATCSVGVAGVDIDPYGNVQACMHLQESAGSLHEQSIEEIWNHSSLFTRARQRAVEAATRFGEQPLQQFGAPLFCLAVEENATKGCGSSGAGCGSCSRP